MLRRPRFKPTANLTTRRAAPITAITTPNDDTIKQNDEIISNPIEKPSEIETASDKVENIENSNKDKPTENGVNRRRLVKPAVNIPTKRSKPSPEIVKKSNDEISENSTETEKVEKPPTEDIEVAKVITNNININNKIQVPNPTIDETCFKSPFALASHNLQSPNASRFTNKVYEQSLIMSPNHQQHASIINGLDGVEPLTRKEQQENYEEMLRGPMSPTKIRQRIRPTPCFSNRRNSIQGNTSEPEDEHNKRQRHYSTSSTYSNNSVNLNINSSNINANINSNNINNNNQQMKLINGNLNGIIKQTNRIRTESSCSNISDLSLSRDIMTKSRNFRSEECQRMAEAKRDFRNRFVGDNKPDKSRLTMYDMIYYNPVTNPMKSSTASVCGSVTGGSISNQNVKERRLSSASSTANSCISKKSMVSIKQEENSMPVPQLKLGPNGEMILDEKSLIIETTLDKEARDKLANADIIYDDEFSGNSGFYKRQRRSREWSAAETIKFYRCLHTIGTDFSLMITLFPKRTRRDLKLKFKKEERTNLQLVNKALMHPKHFNIEDLQLEFDKEEEEYDRNQIVEKELKKKQIAQKRIEIEKLKSKLPGRIISKAMRIMTGGDAAYEMENVPLRKRQISNTKKLALEDEYNTSCDGFIEKLPSFNNVKQFQMMSPKIGEPTTPLNNIEMNNNNDMNDFRGVNLLSNITLNNNDFDASNLIEDITANNNNENINNNNINNDERMNNNNNNIISKEDIWNMEIIFDDTIINNYSINNISDMDIDNDNTVVENIINTKFCGNETNDIDKTTEILEPTLNEASTDKTTEIIDETLNSNIDDKTPEIVDTNLNTICDKTEEIVDTELNDTAIDKTAAIADTKSNITSDNKLTTVVSNRKGKRKPTINLLSRNKRPNLVPITEDEKGKLEKINQSENNEKVNTIQDKANVIGFIDSTDDDNNIDARLLDAKVIEIEKQLQLFENGTTDNEINKDNEISIENTAINLNNDCGNTNTDAVVEINLNVGDDNLINNKEVVEERIESDDVKPEKIVENVAEVNLDQQLPAIITISDNTNLNDDKENIASADVEQQQVDKLNEVINLDTVVNEDKMHDSGDLKPDKIVDNQLDAKQQQVAVDKLNEVINLEETENKEIHVKSENSEINLNKTVEIDLNTIKDDGDDDDDNEDVEFIMVEVEDPNDITKKCVEIYQLNRKTGKLLDQKPLELTKDVMDKIEQI